MAQTVQFYCLEDTNCAQCFHEIARNNGAEEACAMLD